MKYIFDMRPSTIIQYFLLFGFVTLAFGASAQTYEPGACTLIPDSKTCIDSAGCKRDSTGTPVCLVGVALPPGGVTVNQSCWQYSYQYACATNGVDTGASYKNDPVCSVTNSTCQNHASSGLCDEWQYTYECQTQAAVTKEQVVCGDASFDPALMPTPSNPNSTFAQAAVAVEILHEAATYNNNGLIFGGVAESCTKDNTGIHACCDSAPGGKSNSQVASIILGNGASTVKYVGSAAIDWASPYIFDAMYNNSLWTDGLINSFSNGEDLGTNLSSGGFSLSAYGFTYSTTMPAAVDGFTGGDVIAGNSSTGYLSFNVYVFAAMVVIAIVQDMMSCTDQEQLLAVHKGSDLSAFISEECTNTGAFGCSMKTDYFCSFNSVLARIINIQGKTQLGLNIADCQGITTAQLSQIDFSKINFSDFTRSMVQNAQNNTPTNTSLGDGYTPILQTTTQGSSQKTNSATLPAYP